NPVGSRRAARGAAERRRGHRGGVWACSGGGGAQLRCRRAEDCVASAGGGPMIPSGVQVFVALEPIDLRWSFDRLAGVVQERIGYDARGGALFVFFGKRRTAMKVLFFDGSGLCQFYKRLDRGVFRIPQPQLPESTQVEIDEARLDALLDGVEVVAKPKRGKRALLH